MPRSLDASLLSAMNSGVFTPYFKLQLLDSDRTTVLYETSEILGFKLEGLDCTVSFHDPNYWDDWTTWRIQRGAVISGVAKYITTSQFYPLEDGHNKRIRTISGNVFPNQFYSAPGDLTYGEVIDNICSNFGLSAQHSAATWLTYQFLPTGRTLILNDAKSITTILRQKYQVFATDLGDDEIWFYQATSTAPAYPAGYTLVRANHAEQPGHGALKYKRLLSRDESMTTHYSGDADSPIHNLGYLPSTASHPSRYWWTDTNSWIIQDIPPNLKYLDFDAIRVPLDDDEVLVTPAVFREIFDKKLVPSWQWQAKNLDIFANTSGGALPGTIEAAAPYTPLNVSMFNKNLTVSNNNLQSLANEVDELTCGPAFFASGTKPSPDPDDLFMLVDSDTSTHLVKIIKWSELLVWLVSYDGYGRVGVGTASPTHTLDVLSSTSALGIRAQNSSALGSTSGGCLFLNTTLQPDAADRRVGIVSFQGWDGSTTRVGATIAAFSAAAWDNTPKMPSYLSFRTAPLAGGGVVDRIRITSEGNIGIGTTSPNANAILDVASTTKAFMPPRMTTTQRDNIPSPTEGMVIYNTTTHVLNFHNGTTWGAV